MKKEWEELLVVHCSVTISVPRPVVIAEERRSNGKVVVVEMSTAVVDPFSSTCRT